MIVSNLSLNLIIYEKMLLNNSKFNYNIIKAINGT